MSLALSIYQVEFVLIKMENLLVFYFLQLQCVSSLINRLSELVITGVVVSRVVAFNIKAFKLRSLLFD